TNVLVILSDEHTRRVLGSYGNRIVRTPHLDALAARGTRFASAYCQTPICVPSRGSLATGRWPHTIDSWDNATPYVGAEAPSWGHRLTAQGHHVTTVGKLHYRCIGPRDRQRQLVLVIEAEVRVRGDERKVRRHEADEEHPRLSATGGRGFLTEPPGCRLGDRSVVAHVLAFAGARLDDVPETLRA